MATQQIPIHQNVRPIATILSDCTNDQIAFSNNTDLTKNVTNGSMVYRVGSYFYVAPISTKIDPNTGVATAQDAKFAYVTITDGTADTHAASVGQVKSLAGSKGAAGAINVANGSSSWVGTPLKIQSSGTQSLISSVYNNGSLTITSGSNAGSGETYIGLSEHSFYAAVNAGVGAYIEASDQQARLTTSFGGGGGITVADNGGGLAEITLSCSSQLINTLNNRIQHGDAIADNQSATRGQVLPAYGVKSAIRPASPFTKASRTFTIPSGWVFRLGYEDFTAGQLSTVIPNVAGEYLIYLDTGTKALAYTTGSRPAWGAGILVCRLVYSQVSADEISMIWETHGVRTKYDDADAESRHKCIGSMAEISSRPVPADLVYNGSVIGLTNGYMWDEDKQSAVAAKVGATANWAKFYYNGLTAESKNKMERFPADMIGASQAQRNQIFVKDSDVGLGATGRAVFNNVTGTPVLQTIAATSAMLIHIFSSDGVIDSSALVLGQKEYTGSNFTQAVQAAREGCVDEIKSIKMSEGSARDAYHVGSVIINATGQIQYVDAASTQLYIPSAQTLAGSSSGGAGTTPTLEQVLQAGNSAATAMVLGNNLTVSGSIVGSGLYQYGPATASTVPVFNASKQFTSSAVTGTELGYLSGTTESIATSLSNRWKYNLGSYVDSADGTALVGTSSSSNIGAKSVTTGSAGFPSTFGYVWTLNGNDHGRSVALFSKNAGATGIWYQKFDTGGVGSGWRQFAETGVDNNFSVAQQCQATAAQIEAVGSKAVVNIETLNARGVVGVVESTTSTTWTKTLPNETGTWEIDGTITSGSGSGIQFDSNTTPDINYIGHASTGTPSASTTSRVGGSGAVQCSMRVTISHTAGSTKWYVSGSVSRQDNVSGLIYNGCKTTSGTSTTLSLYDTSAINITIRRVK